MRRLARPSQLGREGRGKGEGAVSGARVDLARESEGGPMETRGGRE
jgi:hypothetical protein